MRYLKLLAFVLILAQTSSCSNLSKNTTQSGTFPIRNGVYADKKWTENLIFNRYSWHQELSMQLEILIASVTPQSSFNYWFSVSELERINKCPDFRVIMMYSYDSKIIPNYLVHDQFEKNGFERFEIPEFKRNINQHPDSVMNSLRLYQIFGICRKSKSLEPFKFTIPGYEEKLLN
jgi:hypothetical protein